MQMEVPYGLIIIFQLLWISSQIYGIRKKLQ